MVLTYYIEFNDNIYSCEIIELGDLAFTYIHAKTTPIKDPDNQLIYTLDYNPKPNYNRNLFNPMNKAQSRVLWFFKHDKVFYQNNNIGDAIKNYIKTCTRL